jgi:hypothetical protein
MVMIFSGFALACSVGCGDTREAIPTAVYLALEDALTAKTQAERDLKLYTNLVST